MPTPRARVTVVVPTYNGERYLAGALESVFAQCEPGVELIVVDDGSADRSVAVAERYASVCLRQAHAGPAAARNAGIGAASGELIAFLDQDDEWLTGKLRRQLDHLTLHPEVEFVSTGFELAVEQGVELPTWAPKPAWSPPSSWLVRRSVFDRVGPFDPVIGVLPDLDWVARARAAGVRVDRLPDALVRYRVHERNSSHDRDGFNADYWLILKRSLERKRRRVTPSDPGAGPRPPAPSPRPVPA
jgi:glycosyltransferase involved in cell wall biosynthesis